MRARLVVDKGTVIVSWGYVWCKIRVRLLFDCEGMDNLWWGYDSCILGVRLVHQLDGQSIIISFKGGKLLFKTTPIGALFITDYESSRNKNRVVFKIWTAAPRIEKYKIGQQILETIRFISFRDDLFTRG